MPIDRREFEEAPTEVLDLKEGTQPYEILLFLIENSDKAFTTDEVAEGTEVAIPSARTVLHRLLDRDLVKHNGRYWTIEDDDRLASYAAQHSASSASTTDDFYG